MVMVFLSIPSRGLSVQFLPGPHQFDHVAAGAHDIPGATCPNCKKPLLRLLSLDSRDPLLELDGLARPFVHLLFCWTCPLSNGFTYGLGHDGRIALVDYATGSPESTFPWHDYPVHFAGSAVALVPIDPVVGGSQSHQIGGQPRFVQAPPRDFCPHCGGPMVFLALVADEPPHGGSMCGNDTVQIVFTLCREDRVVSCSQQCD